MGTHLDDVSDSKLKEINTILYSDITNTSTARYACQFKSNHGDQLTDGKRHGGLTNTPTAILLRLQNSSVNGALRMMIFLL
jgi:hypothetical protein